MRRYLEIGLAVLSLAMCILFAALWVRSHRWANIVDLQAGAKPFQIISIEGQLKIMASGRLMQSQYSFDSRAYSVDSSAAATIWRHVQRFANSKGFGLQRGEQATILFPYWFPCLVFATAASVLGFERLRRFSIRSLLVATALFAVLLWIIVSSE